MARKRGDKTPEMFPGYPIEQRTVLDDLAARKARDEAIERVEQGNKSWTERALVAIHGVARTRLEFTTDDVWTHMGREDVEGRAMGAAMTNAARAGLIEKTGRTRKSAMVACHARDKAVWRSLVFDQGSNAAVPPR